MNKVTILFLLLISCLQIEAAVNKSNDKDYVFVSVLGDDSNVGSSENKPLRTIAAAIKTGKDIKLKCGDVFYENVSLNGQNISSYGKGTKPKLCGWKYLTEAKWERYDGNIWRLDLSAESYTGRSKSSSEYLNDVGLIRNVDTGEIFGNKCQCLYKKDCMFKSNTPQMNTWLRYEMDFAQTSKYGKGILKGSDFKYLYLYFTKDPNKMNLAVSTFGNGMSASNSTIDGIAIEGFSCHGIAAGSNTKVINCDIDYIGGAQQVGYALWVRYGNGIEFWIGSSKENGYVANNTISHTFDCGTTIQGSGKVGAFPKNIIIEHNKIYNCRQAFEYFLRNDDKKSGEKYDCVECYFRNNICIDNGDNGFGCPESRDGHVLSYQFDYPASINIVNNTFVGGRQLLYINNPKNIHFGKGNVFYFTDGTTLWSNSKESIVYNGKDSSVANRKPDDKGIDLSGVRLVKVSHKKLERLKKRYTKMNIQKTNASTI